MNVFLHYPGKYGKEFIKPLKIHPDTFVQLALQLTYYKLHGKYVLRNKLNIYSDTCQVCEIP